MCVNEECQEVCTRNNTCGRGAFCSGTNNQIKCSCPEGERGDPMVACIPDKSIKRCLTDHDCQTGLVCMDKECKDPCAELTPCESPLACSVRETPHLLRTMVCSCPELMVVSETDICTESKHNHD